MLPLFLVPMHSIPAWVDSVWMGFTACCVASATMASATGVSCSLQYVVHCFVCLPCTCACESSHPPGRHQQLQLSFPFYSCMWPFPFFFLPCRKLPKLAASLPLVKPPAAAAAAVSNKVSDLPFLFSACFAACHTRTQCSCVDPGGG